MLDLKPINILITTDEITKTVNLDMTFHKPVGKENLYVRFGFGPLKMF